MQLQHNQKFEQLRIVKDGISITLKDVICWIDEISYDFAYFGQNLPVVSIETAKMAKHQLVGNVLRITD